MQAPIFYGLTLTEWILVGTTVFLSLYDALAKLTWGDAATISITLQRACEKDYKVGVIAGLIFAHIFLSIVRHNR